MNIIKLVGALFVATVISTSSAFAAGGFSLLPFSVPGQTEAHMTRAPQDQSPRPTSAYEDVCG